MFLSCLAIFATVALFSAVFYQIFSNQVVGNLKTYSVLLEEADLLHQYQEESFEHEEDGIRITLVSTNGTVIYDSMVDWHTLDNHGERPEINDAKELGEGTAVRKSSTVKKNTFYYARSLEDGTILRVAKDADSIWSIFGSAMPAIFLVVLILLGSSVLMAHLLTKSLLLPIGEMAKNLDHVEEVEVYEELQPFIYMIRKQHDNIIKNAKMRQEFSANVSHELKTPLTSISGYAELIEAGMASEEDVIRFAKGIHKNANRLMVLINDTIRLSELDSTDQNSIEQKENFEELNLNQLASSCMEVLCLSAEKHQVSLALHGSDCYVYGSRQMLEELLYNLCDNAIRYNFKNGSVTVRVYPHKDKTVLVVEDTGIGIPEDSKERVFERFYRVDRSRSKSTGGTGLGLAIVKHIIARHHAELELESQISKGTKITVTFG